MRVLLDYGFSWYNRSVHVIWMEGLLCTGQHIRYQTKCNTKHKTCITVPAPVNITGPQARDGNHEAVIVRYAKWHMSNR